MTIIIFSGDLDPNPEAAAEALRKAGYQVIRECGVDGPSSGEIDPFLRNRAALRGHEIANPLAPTPTAPSR